MVATRLAVWREGADNGWHDDLVWYAAAIGAMKALTPKLDEFQALRAQGTLPDAPELVEIASGWSNPLSLGYQSQVHATRVPANDRPNVAGTSALWHQCAHSHWFFLPWHRAYLVEFESICRTHIKQLGGPADAWALPYWNYSDFFNSPDIGGGNRSFLDLPRPLRDEETSDNVEIPGVQVGPDGRRRNPLFDPTRTLKGETPPGPQREWNFDARSAFGRPHYANQHGTNWVSFGGGVLEEANNPAKFHSSDEHGAVDTVPHGSVHNQVGGNMAGFATAGLDPVFWLHHCNIDRLWEIYARTLDRGYPFDREEDRAGDAWDSWQGQQFRFVRHDGLITTWSSPQLIDTSSLGYVYDNLRTVPVAPIDLPGSNIGPFGAAPAVPPEPVAAAEDVQLDDETNVALSGSDAVTIADAPENALWSLRFDGVRARLPAPTSFGVYLRSDDAEIGEPDFVGVLSLFGAFEATNDPDGPANGVTRRLDLTSRIRLLDRTATLGELRLTLVALDPERDVASAAIKIERVTVEVG